MRKFLFYSIILLCTKSLTAQVNITVNQKVEEVNEFDNLYHWGQFYFSGQPTLEELKFLKENGVISIINLRSDDENKSFTHSAFNEKNVAEDLGFEYHELPIGSKSDYSPKTLTAFTDLMPKDSSTVLIHCKAGGRVTLLMMAYLVNEHKYTMEQAKEFGEQLTYFSHVEALLGK